MKTIRVSIFMLAAIAMLTIFSVSCGNKQSDAIFGVSNVMKRIPSEAVAVAVVNVGQLMNKLDYEEFKKTDIFKRMLQEAKSDLAKEILENPEKSGIATNGQFCMYVDVKGENDFVVGMLLPIKNVKDLEAIFDKSAKAKEDSPFKKIQDKKDFKFIEDTKDDTKIGLGWDKKMMAIVVSKKSAPADALGVIFDTKRKESIMTNKNFKADKAEGHDMMIWMQSDPIVKLAQADKKMARNLKQITLLGLTEEALNGNTVALYYDFKKGEMETGLSYKMNEQIEKEYGIIFKKKIDTDFSPYFPKKHLSGITMMGFDMKGLKEVMKKRSVDGFVDGYLGGMGLTLDEIVKGFNGEIAMASYVDPAATDALNAQKVVLAISFEKGDLLDKLLKVSKELGAGEIKKSGERYMSAMSKDVQGVLKNNVFVISNDLSVIEKIEKGGFKGDEAIEKEYYTEMKKGWLSGHVDYGQLLATLEEMPLGAAGVPDMSGMLKMLNQYNELLSTTAVATTEEAKVIVTLKNKEENSLKVLSNTLNKLYNDREKIQKEMENLEADDKKENM